ncbi:MAG TPA: 4Fe-4S dicluster domain-containing protein [bacterium]|nr:4Fe-4S dicluster domain-containing protein [bacterium]HOL47533.1 4Fe-4S dicluster domain-containing protein [bacterium]HPQ19115.1 4Fe-4S dicluster domain-containing protein [bacterium]
MKLPKIRELIEAIKILFTEKRFTSKFPFVIEPMLKGMRGFPELQDECIGCGACVESCPAKAISKIEDEEKKKRKIRYDRTRCILCNTCAANCTTKKGVILKDKYDMSDFKRDNIVMEKEFDTINCEVCNKIITTKEHFNWLIEKLGILVYNNPTLMKYKNIKDKLSEEINIKLAKDELRADIGKYLCSEHKRTEIIKDLWS